MPIARVQIGGRIARIEVPDGTTPEQAQAIAMRMAGQSAPPPVKEKPTSFWQGVAEGFQKPLTNAVRAAENFIPPLGLLKNAAEISNLVSPRPRGAPPRISPLSTAPVANNLDRWADRKKAASPYQGSTAGRITGNVIATAPSLLVPGGLLAQGAAAGALGSEDSSVSGMAKNAALGAAGGYVGGRLVGGVARAVSPRVAPAVAALQARGVPLTIGQIAGANGGTVGRMVRGMENKLTSVPGVGNAIVNAQRRGTEAFNRAAFDEALAPIQANVGHTTEHGVEHAQQAVRDAYAGALHGVDVTPDRQFADELVNSAQRGMAPGQYAEDFRRIMQDEVQPVLANGTGQLSGQNLQDALRMTRGYGRQYNKLATTGTNGVPQPAARPVGAAFNDLGASLEGLIGRQAPGTMEALEAANLAYRNVGVVRDAVSAAKNSGGVFTPAQLSQAARANAKKFGGTQGTTDQPFFDLTRAGQDVLPNDVPNSGTADRGIMGLVLGGTVGLPAVAASGAASLPYTAAGQRAAEWTLTGRQGPTSRAVAEALRRLRPAGVLGSSAAFGLLGS